MAENKILLESGTNELELAEFHIKMTCGKMQGFGINVAKVREIIMVPDGIKKVPNSHECIVGIFKLRERIIPLVDLACYLKQDSKVDLTTCKVIITEFNQQSFGFLIHDIATIHRVSWTAVLPPSNMIRLMADNCVNSFVILEDKILLLLDFEKIVADINPELAVKFSEAGRDKSKIELRNKYKLMVAEDSSLIRNLAFNALSEAGYEIDLFNDGQAAWDKLEQIKKSAGKSKKSKLDYDLVITDIEMPRMDGHALCRKIKEDNLLNKLPVILFSSLISEDLKRKGEALGADAQISKPDLARVVDIISEFLD